MGIEENKATLHRVFEEVWNNNNLEVADECFAENFVRHGIGGRTADLNEFKQFLVRVRGWIPDIQRTLDDMVAEGDMIAFSFKWKGTDTGGFGGNTPTGKYVTVQECYFARFENCKIVEITQHADALGPFQELGIIPSTEQIQKEKQEAITIEKNKASLHRLIEEVYNNNDLNMIPELVSPDFVSHVVPEYGGHEGLRKHIIDFRKSFPDTHITINQMLAEGDMVGWSVTLTGTQTEEFVGIAPSSKKISSTAIIISRMEDGKEAERWQGQKQGEPSILQQLVD